MVAVHDMILLNNSGDEPMTFQLSLPPDLEKRLHLAASKNGKPAEQYAVQLLEENTPSEKNLAAIEMLEAWAKEDEAMSDEESAENEAILRAINENGVSI
jgi:hypothetical protein